MVPGTVSFPPTYHPLPPRYAVVRVDDHFIWVYLTEDGNDYTEESPIHWSAHTVRRWAFADARRRAKAVR